MRKMLVVLGMFAVEQVIAQNYVHIPDSVFASYLETTIPDAMYGDSLDITSLLVTIETDSIDISGLPISNIEGIQYFSSLKYINSYYCAITTIPSLPSSLRYLECGRNLLEELPTLPDSLTHLFCGGNLIAELPVLPHTLFYLSCGSNLLTNLPPLPNSLRALSCPGNSLLTQLPVLPDSLEVLRCMQSSLSTLPVLPNTLTELMCFQNELASLPELPNSLTYLNCASNYLTSLPVLPDSLQTLYCQGNSLTSLPDLPRTLERLWCNSNNISCFPVFPESLLPSEYHSSGGYWTYWLEIGANPFNCVPNYLPDVMDPTTLAYPICAPEPVPVIDVNGTTLTCISGGLSYQWFYNGSHIIGATSNVLNNATGCGNYTVTVGDVNGCRAVSEPIYCPMGLNEETNNIFSLYPNPATTELTITGYAPAYLKLCNTLGQTVAEASKSNKLYVGNLPQGLYVLQVFDEKGLVVKTEKVVVGK